MGSRFRRTYLNLHDKSCQKSQHHGDKRAKVLYELNKSIWYEKNTDLPLHSKGLGSDLGSWFTYTVQEPVLLWRNAAKFLAYWCFISSNQNNLVLKCWRTRQRTEIYSGARLSFISDSRKNTLIKNKQVFTILATDIGPFEWLADCP